MDKDLEIIIAIHDTYHDFHNNKSVFIKDILTDFHKYYSTYLNVEYKDKFFRNFRFKDKLDKILQNRNFGVVESKDLYRTDFIEYVIQELKIEPKSMNKMHQTILGNFQVIFDIDVVKHKLELLKLRMLLYYTIDDIKKNNVEGVENLLLLNRLLLIDKPDIHQQLQIIKEISNNITYPITYFDDMTNGIQELTYFKYHIFSEDKDFYDGASTRTLENHIKRSNLALTMRNKNYSNLNAFITFRSNEYKKDILGINYSYSNKKIIIHYMNETNEYTFEVLKNDRESAITILDYIYKFKNEKIYETSDMETLIIKCKEYFTSSSIIQINDRMAKNIILLSLSELSTIFLGIKRYGDWIQSMISKDNYFILQTNDYYCLLYMICIGAPVMMNDILYNTIPPKLEISNKNYGFMYIQKEALPLENIENNYSLYYTKLNGEAIDVPFHRNYFQKYLTLKQLYKSLKN